jgi:hypothetical protein
MKEGQTVLRRILTSTPFARVELHTVRTPAGGLVHDWLWLDIKDQVRDKAELRPGSSGSPHALLKNEI